MAKQLSVFAENARGSMASITDVLAESSINITALVTNDSAEYGIVRMIVSDPEGALGLLRERGYLCKLAEVLCVYIGDEPGCLARLLGEIAESGVNVDYLYVSYDRETAAPIAILHTGFIEELASALAAKGYSLQADA